MTQPGSGRNRKRLVEAFRAVEKLAQEGVPGTVNDVARELGVDSGVASRLVEELIDRGAIERQRLSRVLRVAAQQTRSDGAATAQHRRSGPSAPVATAGPPRAQ
jgi:DNA-binding MarR family transcriptional regulator